MRPSFGQQIAWGESNAIVFANSVLGARTERYPDLFDICCAITGRAPAAGLHLAENRAGQLLFRLVDIPEQLQRSDDFYPVLGNLIGRESLDKIPVIDGMLVRPDEDLLKAFGAATASSGGVALFHMVQVTPEAPTLEAAFQGKTPLATIEITMDMLRRSRLELTHTDSSQLHMVVLGSPHFSLAEYRRLAPMLEGKRKHPDVKFLVTSSRAMTQLAEQAGFMEPLRDFRRPDHCGYLHPDLAHAAGGDPKPDDQLGQVRLLCTRTAGQENRFWQPGGLCQLGNCRADHSG